MIWDVATWEAKVKLKDNKGSFKSVLFSPDGKVLAATAMGRSVKLWETATGKQLVTLEEDADINQIIAGAFSPDGKTLVLGVGFKFGKSRDPIRLWNWAENKASGSLKAGSGGALD